MARRHTPIVILLPVGDMPTLQASATRHGHDVYLHAHWLLAQALGLTMPVSPTSQRDEALTDAVPTFIASPTPRAAHG